MRRASVALWVSTWFLGASSPFAHAEDGPTAQIDAVWTPTGFRGRLTPTGLERATWVDPQAGWPAPHRDIDEARTWPGRPKSGGVTWTEMEDGSLVFEATLPRRYGDLGATRHGHFANGAWYPQPLVDGRLPVVAWTVRLQTPDDRTAIVGGRDGGRAERVAVAVVPRGRWTAVGDAWLLTKGRPRRPLVRGLESVEASISPDGLPLRGAVVEAPLRRRLVRAGPGVAFVSDRAFRLSPGVQGAHLRPVALGVAEAWLPLPADYEREVAAASLILDREDALGGLDSRRALRTAAWLPMVDALLHDRRLPFVGEVLGDAHPSDPLRDDLVEHWQPATPGAAVVAQAWDAFGLGPARSLWRSLVAETEPQRAGIPADFLDARRAAYAIRQDYRLEVIAPEVRVHRDAPADAPPEPLVVQVDGVAHVLDGPAGPGVATLTVPEGPHRVIFDPERHLAQTDRAGETWPPARTLTAYGLVSTINLDEGWLIATGALSLRPKDDTRRQWTAAAYTNRDTRAALTLGVVHKAGAPIDGLQRAHRLRAWVSPAWLNPTFAEVPAPIALGAGGSWRWDTRVDLIYPTRGHATLVSADAGFLPGTDAWWATSQAGAVGLWAPHPRWVFAGRATGGLAAGDVPQRLLALGGPDALRSVAANAVVGTALATGAGELRWAPFRGRSVPMGALWGSELHLSAGAEAGWLHTPTGPVSASGLTAGVAVVGDWLGASPALAGLTLGWPLRAPRVDGAPPAGPTLYLRWGQAF